MRPTLRGSCCGLLSEEDGIHDAADNPEDDTNRTHDNPGTPRMAVVGRAGNAAGEDTDP